MKFKIEEQISKLLSNNILSNELNRDIITLIKCLRVLYLEEQRTNKFTKDCYTIVVKSILKRIGDVS